MNGIITSAQIKRLTILLSQNFSDEKLSEKEKRVIECFSHKKMGLNI